MSKKKIVLITCGVIVGFLVLIVVGLFLLGILAAFLIPSVAKEAKYDDSKQIATAFKTSVENACISYVDMGKEYPTKFAQFLSVPNNDSPSMDTTLNMDYLGYSLVKPDNQSELDSNTFNMELNTGFVVTYTLGSNCSVEMVEKQK